MYFLGKIQVATKGAFVISQTLLCLTVMTTKAFTEGFLHVDFFFKDLRATKKKIKYLFKRNRLFLSLYKYMCGEQDAQYYTKESSEGR